MIKYIFCDFDGTLFNDKKEISKQDFLSIKEAVDKGIKFIPCSGRIDSFGTILDDLGIKKSKDDYIIGADGSVVIRNDGKIIKEQYLLNNLAIEFVELLIKYKCDFFVCGMERKMSYGSGEHMNKIFYNRNPYMKETRYVDVDLLRDIAKNDRIAKIQFINSDLDVMEIIKKKIKEIGKDEAEFSYAEQGMIDITARGSNKKEGFLSLIEYLNIDINEALAIGDNGNDLELLKVAGIGACPSNALEEVKKIADYVSKYDNNNNAVSDIIKKFIK